MWFYLTVLAIVLAGMGILVSLSMRVGKGKEAKANAEEEADASARALGIVSGKLRSVRDAIRRLSDKPKKG